MTQDPISVRTTDTVKEAILLLERLDIRHLPVISENGALVGMLSDRDLRGTLGATDQSEAPPPWTRIRNVMSEEVVQALPDDELSEVADLMVNNRIGAVPIVDARGGLVGIVSYVDVLRSMIDAQP